MKRTLAFLLFLSATTLTFTAATPAFGQAAPQTKRPQGYYKVIPMRGATVNEARISAAAATTIPLWDFSITSPVDNLPYAGMMVGRSPFFHGARTTNIPTVIVPIKLVMPDGGVFDPTAADPACSPSGTALSLVQASPILQSAAFTLGGTAVGTTQYTDAYQRSNFWTNVSVTGDRYHTMLSPVTTVAVVTVSVPAGSGTTNTSPGGCGKLGIMDINWWQPHVEGTIIPSLAAQGVNPTALPLFLFYNVVMTQGPPTLTGGTCCILGYHTATAQIQTYTVSDFDTTGSFGPATAAIAATSHEVGEWMDDPLGNNVSPVYGHIGQVTGCQNSLENGDPLSGTFMPPVAMPNGVSYTPQELAFYSWFFRQSPSIGVNGWYSDNGTFATGAGPLCM
jgi:hypothetical protein